MKKLFACLLLLLLAIPGKAEAASTVMDQMRRASLPEATARAYRYADHFVERYYLGKPSFRVNDFLHILNQSRMLDGYPHAEPFLAAFMGVLFRENPDRALEWLTPPPPRKRGKGQLINPPTRYSDEMLKMLQHAVWLSGRSGDEKIARLFAKTPAYLSKEAPQLADAPVMGEEYLDALWGAFLASGDAKYAERIIDAACGFRNSAGDPLPDPALQKTAAAALKENAKAHEFIARALRARVRDKKSPCGKALLAPLLPKPLDLGKMDGEFSADLLLADYRDSTKLMGGPLDAVVDLPAVKKLEPPAKISVILTFSGMAMREDLATDVDFDFVLIGPNGKPVEKSEIKKRKISPIKRSGRYIRFHPNSFMSLFFKKEYPAGPYTVKVTIRDNIGGKKISLQEKVDFVNPAP